MRGTVPGVLALLGLSLVLTAEGVRGQTSSLWIEARGGLVAPVGSFAEPGALPAPAEEGLEPAASFGLHLGMRWSAHASIHLGFSQHRFSCPPVGCPGSETYVHTGWDVGGRLRLATGAVRPWIGSAIVFARVERAADGMEEPVELSDLSVGFDGGAGVEILVGRRFRIVPGVRFAWMNTRFPRTELFRMRYLVTDLGLVVGF